MSRLKRVCISVDVHRRLKLLAARRNMPMRQLLERLVDREARKREGPWLSPGGLRLQGKALARVWADPALEVYDPA